MMATRIILCGVGGVGWLTMSAPELSAASYDVVATIQSCCVSAEPPSPPNRAPNQKRAGFYAPNTSGLTQNSGAFPVSTFTMDVAIER